jgi:hypothetical protein
MTPPPAGAPVPPTFNPGLPRTNAPVAAGYPSAAVLGPRAAGYPAAPPMGPAPGPGAPGFRPAAKSKTAWPIVIVLVALGLIGWFRCNRDKLPWRSHGPVVAAVDAGAAAPPAQDAGALVVPIAVDGGAKVLAQLDPGARTQQAQQDKPKHDATKDKPKKPDPRRMPAVPSIPEVKPLADGARRAGEALTSLYSGTYHGRIENLTHNQRSTGRLLLSFSGSAVTGYLTISPPLVGSGPVVGTITGNQLQLRVSSSYGIIAVRGVVIGKSIYGTYTVGAERGSFNMKR